MLKFPLTVPLAMAGLALSGCAQLYQVHIGDIRSDEGDLAPFELKVDELGINVQEAAEIGKAIAKNKDTQKKIDGAAAIIALFQYGPRTGNMVFSDTYADELAKKVLEKCPSGRITGLVSIRETRKYPTVSGEIVKIKGYCILQQKGKDSNAT